MPSCPDSRGLRPPVVAAATAALVALAVGAGGCGGGSDELEPGVSVELEPVAGQVLVREPQERTFVTLDEAAAMPVGTQVDASRGAVLLTSARGDGDAQSGRFSRGEFEVEQPAGQDAVTLSLRGGDFSPCKTRAARLDESTVGGPVIRDLFANADGDFRTKGRFAAATVRGTEWRTVDACFGTLTDVATGEVTVTDLIQDRTVEVGAGDDLWVARNP
jgi:hypothetical protein